jgi:hypothetical protein
MIHHVDGQMEAGELLWELDSGVDFFLGWNCSNPAMSLWLDEDCCLPCCAMISSGKRDLLDSCCLGGGGGGGYCGLGSRLVMRQVGTASV